MHVRRVHLFEIHDQPWFPDFLRDQVTDALQMLLNTARIYRPVVPCLAEAIGRAGTNCVLDLCSGAGGPWNWLHDVLQRALGRTLYVMLTDKYPNAVAAGRAAAGAAREIQFCAVSVAAENVPRELAGFRTVFTSFHHFRPEQARRILQDTVAQRQGIGIFEAPGRHVITLLQVMLIPLAALLIVPALHPFRWSRLVWTYLVPVVPFVLWFDGVVSCLRVYSPDELRELVDGIAAPDYTWHIGVEKASVLSVPITYLIGYPTSAPSMGVQ
jgi:hypothetical protein